MKQLQILILLFCITINKMDAQAWKKYPIYNGNDLGVTYTPTSTTFKVWCPTASEVKLRLYSSGAAKPDNSDLLNTVNFQQQKDGVWSIVINGNLKGNFYTYQTKVEDKVMLEVPDIYAKSVGVNGKRGMVVDLADTNPSNWQSDVSPAFAKATDAVLYELHVRDASISSNSGIKNKGKFIGLTEKGTKNDDGLSTGLDHIKSLGVTHVHLLPMYDYYTIDESAPYDPKKYNWGYDPLNYNVPEGSYSTNPFDGVTRIKEFKQLVQTFHNNGLRVVMDVVYNHTMFGAESYFHQLVPNYYHRQDKNGGFSNGSGCGNETASDRDMMRKFMLESVKYWVEEYHVDGFRFDLMALHDIETMNLISKELHAIKPDIIIYGEGWTGGDTPLEEDRKTKKQSIAQVQNVAAFSDDMRDALKGGWSNHNEKGYVSGRDGQQESIKFGIVGATQHPQVDYNKVNYSRAPWAAAPSQCINYDECHDNHTLWDRLGNSNPEDDEATKVKMFRLAQTIVLTSQGISFIHAGGEFLRTKQNIENSFNHPDAINQIDWARKTKFKTEFEYYSQLIALRRAHPAFRMATTAEISQNLTFLNDLPNGVITFTLNGNASGDTWKNIIVAYNPNRSATTINLPVGEWKVALANGKVNKKLNRCLKGNAEIEAIGTLILVRK